MRLRFGGIVLAALSLAACATTPPPLPPAASAPAAPQPAPPAAPRPAELAFHNLPGWTEDDHAAAFRAFRATCGAARSAQLAEVCRRARAEGELDDLHARAFFEANFRAEQVGGDGMLTAYFAPEYPARSRPDGEFSAPVRARPSDLVTIDAGVFDPALAGVTGVALQTANGVAPYPDRATIEARPPEKALAWMRPEDLFFLQIQGSGVLTFETGARMKANFAGHNGRPFVGVATPMRDQGLLPPDGTSGEAIRSWLAANRGPQAEAIMRLNPRYVFFKLAPDDGAQPVGSAGVPLPPGRAIAVDPSRHAMGEIFWLDATAPSLTGAFPAYRRLAVALDTGGAIKGDARADLYLGLGPQAGAEAGRVRHVLKMYRLTPRPEPQS
ncbi:MAG: MltA domain-containing protein [Phenylobacterium sp.]|uniref:MltA domain-containing protein n=1 Tax=Phenylobacterium sp. TaxID=1871053 RepID=UPI00391C77FB